MTPSDFGFSATRVFLLALLLLLVTTVAEAGNNDCKTSGEYGFVCGPVSAEDLVLVPGTKWIIASGFAPGASIMLIDSQRKSWTSLYPADSPRAIPRHFANLRGVFYFTATESQPVCRCAEHLLHLSPGLSGQL